MFCIRAAVSSTRRRRRWEAADAFANQPGMVRPARTTRHFAYLLRCGDGTLYAGYTPDPARRLAAHRGGRAARYTRGRGPWTFAAVWRCPSRSSALALERLLKRIGRPRRLSLVAGARLSRVVPEAAALRARRVNASALARAG